MSTTKAITLRLDPADYEQLDAEARRFGMAPATLARVYVRAGLNSDGESKAARVRQAGLDALRGLADLRARLPDNGTPVDVVEIVGDGRRERDRQISG